MNNTGIDSNLITSKILSQDNQGLNLPIKDEVNNCIKARDNYKIDDDFFQTKVEDYCFNSKIFDKFRAQNFRFYNSSRTNFSQDTQSWICEIIEINSTTFFAKMQDLKTNGTYEYSTFIIDEVVKEDRDLITIGAIFYVSIGFVVRKGTKVSEKILRFKRNPTISIDIFDQIIDEADDLYHFLLTEDLS